MLDHLNEALEKAGMDPEGVRALILEEALNLGLVQKKRSPAVELVATSRVFLDLVNQLLSDGVEARTIISVVQKLIPYLELRCAQEFADMAIEEP